MSESSIVRLVRCPKCENLLQEPSECSVYQCGGCGTVLRAKKNGFVENGDLDVSDEKGIRVPDKIDDNAATLVDDFSEENAKERNVNEEASDKIIDENGTSNGKNPSLPPDLDVAARLEKRTGLRPDQNRRTETSHDRFRHSPDVVHNRNWVQDRSNSRYNVNSAAYDDSTFESEPQEYMLLEESRSRPNVNSRYANDLARKRGFVNFSYPDEGPSNLGVGSYGNYTDQAKYEDQLDRLARVKILENDRVELLRKLDELTNQLTRSCNVADVPKETRFHDPRIPFNDAVNQPGSSMDHLIHGYSSYMGRNGSDFLESYPNTNHLQEYRGFSDVYHPHMLRRPPYQLTDKYLNRSCYEHFPAQYMDFNRDLFIPEPHETFHHNKPTCSSCMHPLNNNLYVPRKSQHPPLTRSSSDLGVESSGFGRWRLKMPVAVTKRDQRRVFHPIAGGAPFITCCNCSQVLKMSRKFIPMQEKKQNKIKCEACSSVLMFEFEKKGVVLSVPTETDEVFVDISAANGVTDTSDEFENHNVESNTSLRAEMFNSDVGEVGLGPHSFSSGDSEDEPIPDGENSIHSSELILKDNTASLHLTDSPCDEYLDKPSSDSAIDRKGQNYKQNSLKDALVATEIDVSYEDNSSPNEQPKINKMADSFFLGLIKKSFGEFSRSRQATENKRSNVSVNGHFLTDRVVKKAEKLAGPIQPGDYWYDYRAGFWGVMGHPCLGIILPNIDEFNCPMPENCGGGNTGVYLNGRELHRKDLDLLASRGLPITSHKSYLIDISGRVMDEDTGEELDLGKLAPTVEKAKHGFGMKVPKTILKQ